MDTKKGLGRLLLVLVVVAVSTAAARWLRSPMAARALPQRQEAPGQRTEWRGIRLAAAKAAAPRWSSPHPARLAVHEQMAARVGSPVSARVSQVFVELGDTVRKGDRLFAVSSSDVAELRIELRRATAALQTAKVRRDRTVALVNARALAGTEEIEAQMRVRQAQLDLTLATAKLAAWRVPASGESELVVLAPRDGIVVKKDVLAAQRVTSYDTLIEVADLSRLIAVAEVFEMDAGRLEVAAPVRITSPSKPEWFVDATVQMLASVADPRRRTIGVRALVPNAGLELRPNTYIEMSLREAELPNAVEIPLSAVSSDGRQASVYVQSGPGRFERREVEVTVGRGSHLVVTSGLSAGELVVEHGFALLDNREALD